MRGAEQEQGWEEGAWDTPMGFPPPCCQFAVQSGACSFLWSGSTSRLRRLEPSWQGTLLGSLRTYASSMPELQ